MSVPDTSPVTEVPEPGRLLSINVGETRLVEHEGRNVPTGIYKEPVAGGVRVGMTGLVGDRQADLENHGGPDKAVYVYSGENYPIWREWLAGRVLPFGYFGENFTVSGMTDDVVQVGDVWQAGEVVFQVTQPRVPCFKLGIRVGDARFPKAFLRSGRTGFYFRVLREGLLSAGLKFTRIVEDPAGLTVQEAMLALRKGPRQREVIVRALGIEALSASWRQSLSKRLEDL